MKNLYLYLVQNQEHFLIWLKKEKRKQNKDVQTHRKSQVIQCFTIFSNHQKES